MSFVYVIKKVLAVMITLIMFIGVKPNGKEAHTVLNEDTCKLCISVLSDVHIETNNLARYNSYATMLKDCANNSFGNDVALFLGDNTMNGQLLENLLFYGAQEVTHVSDNIITCCGNHDVGNGEGNYDSLISQFIGMNNEFFDAGIGDTPWYYRVIDGYYFIVLCPEDLCVYEMPISDAQYKFLDETLAMATAEGKPAFVVCHYPVSEVGDDWGERVEEILGKYKNVFWISGHTHMPVIKGWTFDNSWGYNEVNLPRCTELSGDDDKIYEGTGYGVQLEVYEDEVVGRVRNYYTGEWEDYYEFHFELEKQ